MRALLDRGLKAIAIQGGGEAALALVGAAAGLAALGVSTIYHVTYAANLPSIAENGLLPSSGVGGGVGRGSYKDWSKDKVFLTGKKDVWYWFGRVEEHGFDRSDDMHADMLVPVVLRVKNLRRVLKKDEVAANESRADSFYVRRRIPSSQLEVFTGSGWKPVTAFTDEESVLSEIVDPAMHLVEDEDGARYDWKLARRESPRGPVEMIRTYPPKLRP